MGQGFTIRQLLTHFEFSDDDFEEEAEQPMTAECECCSCGKRKAVEWRKNPKIAEVWPEDENPEQWWCEDCWHERKGDI